MVSTLVEAEIQTKTYFALQIKRPSILTDYNQTSSVYSACAKSSNHNDPPVEAEIQTKTCFALQVKCPTLSTDRNQAYNVYSAETAKYDDPGNIL